MTGVVTSGGSFDESTQSALAMLVHSSAWSIRPISPLVPPKGSGPKKNPKKAICKHIRKNIQNEVVDRWVLI